MKSPVQTPVVPGIFLVAPALVVSLLAAGCAAPPPATSVRASGHVEATEVRIASEVGGRILDLAVNEGQRVSAGEVIARLDTADVELALARARAERAQADAQLRLLLAGARPEDVRQARAQLAAAEADGAAADREVQAAETEARRFEALLAANSGSVRQRDEAVARRDTASARAEAARQRVRSAEEALARLNAGARREEVDAARARVASVDAGIATLEKAVHDATVVASVSGTVTETLADAGELAQPRMPLVVLTDLDHAWANVYVDEPIVPRLRIGQTATIFTDAGGDGVPGTITFVSPRAEFTPRNVQTAADRSKLVYRVKVTVDNRDGVLKVGMPVEAEIPLP